MDLRPVPFALLSVALAYLLAGLALQHGAYILQYGSVFAGLRGWLERTACAPGASRSLRWLCRWGRELVTCQLCSITQMAVWFCALPATAFTISALGSRPLGLPPWLAAWGYVLMFLGVTFSTAAVGLLCWDLARMVGRGTEAVVLYLRARKDAAELETRLRQDRAAFVAARARRRPGPRPVDDSWYANSR
jgi:hypothetical protein